MAKTLAKPSPSGQRSGRLSGAGVLGGMIVVMWVVEAINSLDSQRLDSAGIRPRQIDGLAGILLAPFIHASFSHLFGNTIPLIILGGTIVLTEGMRLATITALVGLVAGLGTWAIAPGGSVTVGASGIVFGFAAYLIGRGVFSRRLLQLAIGVAVGLAFGVTLLYSLIPRSGISWQDHLFGAIGGILAARALAARDAPQRLGETRH